MARLGKKVMHTEKLSGRFKSGLEDIKMSLQRQTVGIRTEWNQFQTVPNGRLGTCGVESLGSAISLLVNGILKQLISNQHGSVYDEIKFEIVSEQDIPDLSWKSYSLLLINKKL